MEDLGSAHLHRLYMATGTMLAKLSEFADQSGHEDFVALHRDKMRMMFEQVLGGLGLGVLLEILCASVLTGARTSNIETTKTLNVIATSADIRNVRG